MTKITLQRVFSQKDQRLLDLKKPSLKKRAGQPRANISQKKLVDHTAVKFSIKDTQGNKDINKYVSLKEKNEILLVFTILTFPLVIPAIFLGLAMLHNQNKMAHIKENLLPSKQDYHGAYLYEMSKDSFKQTLSDTYATGKHQIVKDALRGLQIQGNDFRDISKAIMDNPELDYLLNRLIDGQDMSHDIEEFSTNKMILDIQNVMLKRVKTSGSEFVNQFLSKEDILSVFTKDILLAEIDAAKAEFANATTPEQKIARDVFEAVKSRMDKRLLDKMVNEKSSVKLIKFLMPQLDKKQIETLIRSHNQSMMTAAQHLVDFSKLLGSGYMLTQAHKTDIYFNEEICLERYQNFRFQISNASLCKR